MRSIKIRKLGFDFDFSYEFLARELGAKVALKVAHKAVLWYLRFNRFSIGASWDRESLEKAGELKPRGYPYNK